ncbi:MAG TPA: hypothetical protein VE974_13305 [Thermoanaerobaculia bacterium]|nr:hypothetical protein [Thermoanaerobaculia bacterium]
MTYNEPLTMLDVPLVVRVIESTSSPQYVRKRSSMGVMVVGSRGAT